MSHFQRVLLTGAAGRVGMGLLQRYRVLLDPAAGHMILAEPGPVSAVQRQ